MLGFCVFFKSFNGRIVNTHLCVYIFHGSKWFGIFQKMLSFFFALKQLHIESRRLSNRRLVRVVQVIIVSKMHIIQKRY